MIFQIGTMGPGDLYFEKYIVVSKSGKKLNESIFIVDTFKKKPQKQIINFY